MDLDQDTGGYEAAELVSEGSETSQKIALHLANKWVDELSNANLIPTESAGEQLYCWLVDSLQTKSDTELTQYLNARERRKLNLE
jgi:hypothetical protein